MDFFEVISQNSDDTFFKQIQIPIDSLDIKDYHHWNNRI